MSTAGRRRPLLCLAILLGFWFILSSPCFSCRAAAIRIFPPNRKAEEMDEALIGRRPIPPGFAATVGPPAGFDETKRRVPSCPDPLHNRLDCWTWEYYPEGNDPT